MTIETLEFDAERRVFVRGLGLVSLSLLSASLLGGCESLVQQIANRPTRRRLRTGSALVDEDIACYRQAVAAMKALPGSDPRSWQAQAAMHGTVAGGFNLCQHGTDHFFSWHRAYLRYFELICCELTGNPRFGLPYWNWNQNPAIHSAFLTPGDALFHPRNSTTMAGSFAVSAAALDPALADPNFFTFSGSIESTPHNSAHVQIGANMGTGGSANDPIFWMHHCMVDYCWAKWNIELDNDNTNQSNWLNTSWNHFFDAQGAPATVTAGLTTIMPLLSYQYESSAIGSSPAEVRVRASAEFAELRARIERGVDVRFEVRRRFRLAEAADLVVGKPFTSAQRVSTSDVSNLIVDARAPEQFFVSIELADYPRINDFFVRVFINLPGATAATPTSDAHYAGSFAIFGVAVPGHQAHHHSPNYLVNVTEAVRRLAARGELPDSSQLSVQLVTVPAHERLASDGVVLKIQKLELLVTPLRLKK